ncbi:MAG TPA: SRPBCC domain-containing protein [Terracidiphilus sp.]|nr:SRPBCC domain-containing protein [Terracidiphilus sp.]
MSLAMGPSVIADKEHGIILATVEIAAAPERVFEALTRAKDVLRWWGSDNDHRTTLWEADVRPDGKWRAGGRMADGRAYKVEGEFAEVDVPRKLVFTWRADWDAPNETRVTYLLEPLEQGTRLTLHHEGFAGRVAACNAHTSGWRRVLGWLQADLRPAPAAVHYFLFKLLAPRLSFMQDMTADERALMQSHVAYWTGKMAEGKIIAFGPVADPAGGWGMGLLRVSDAAEVEGLTANDPVMLAGKGFRYEVFPMPRAVHL